MPAVEPLVQLQRLGQLKADREARVQAGLRVLEDHGHVLARQPASLGSAQGAQIPPVESQTVGANAGLEKAPDP